MRALLYILMCISAVAAGCSTDEPRTESSGQTPTRPAEGDDADADAATDPTDDATDEADEAFFADPTPRYISDRVGINFDSPGTIVYISADGCTAMLQSLLTGDSATLRFGRYLRDLKQGDRVEVDENGSVAEAEVLVVAHTAEATWLKLSRAGTTLYFVVDEY